MSTPSTDPAVLDALTTRLMRRTSAPERAAAMACLHDIAAIAQAWPAGPRDDRGDPLDAATSTAWQQWQQVQDWGQLATRLRRLIELAEHTTRTDTPRLI